MACAQERHTCLLVGCYCIIYGTVSRNSSSHGRLRRSRLSGLQAKDRQAIQINVMTSSESESTPLLSGTHVSSRLLYTIIVVLSVLVVLLLAGFITALIIALADDSSGSDLPSWPPPSESPLGQYSKYAVSSNNGLCSEIGRNILLAGGNAVDAIIAVDICIGVTDPHSSGLGGGLFMTIYNSTTRQCYVIDARETAPAAATQDMYVGNPNASTIGWQSIGVPGDLHGLWTAYTRFGGGLPWSQLLQPTIDLLETGLPCSQSLAKTLLLDDNYPYIMEPNSTLSVFIDPATGQPYKEGDVVPRPQLRDTLEKLASTTQPVSKFYDSTFTKSFVDEIQAGGGLITMGDMSSYSSIVRPQSDVIYTQLRPDLRVCGPPPPSSVGVASSLLNIMSGYNIDTDESLDTVNGNVELYHRFIEAMKFVYGDRSRLGDMDYVPTALNDTLNITTATYAAWIRSRILPTAQPFDYYDADFAANRPDYGTSQHNTVDAQGNAVSITSTINQHFGSKRRSLKTGIIWNDEMDDFSTPNQTNAFGYPPSEQNFIEPGKRPMSSMSPMVIFSNGTGQVRLVTGGAGGSRIISGTAYTAMRALWMNETVKQANDAPRLHNQLAPIYTRYEAGFPQVYLDGLRARGQNLTLFSPFNEVDTIALQPAANANGRSVFSACDWRKGDDVYPAGV